VVGDHHPEERLVEGIGGPELRRIVVHALLVLGHPERRGLDTGGVECLVLAAHDGDLRGLGLLDVDM